MLTELQTQWFGRRRSEAIMQSTRRGECLVWFELGFSALARPHLAGAWCRET